jgi:hypothetical protein
MSAEAFRGNPVAESHRLLDFDAARIERVGIAGTPTLIVTGTAPCINMVVALSPRIYVTCPEWWGIEVVGHLPGGVCLTAIKPFEVCIPLPGIIGSRGIEVIGASNSERIEQQGGCS